MNNTTTKDAKTAAKAQKKIQKSNKKQQSKQQLQQQQQQTSRNAKGTTATTAAATSHATITAADVKKVQHNNNNTITHNNNNVHKTKGKDLQQQPPPSIIQPAHENAPKFERSNSFSLKGKLSKLYNSITGSKENLHKPETDKLPLPYTFVRSRSLILPRRTNRRSLIEPQLEQLSEEVEKSSDPTSPSSPRKNSIETANGVTPSASHNASQNTVLNAKDLKTPRRPTSQMITSTPNDNEEDNDDECAMPSPAFGKLQRKGSTMSLAAMPTTPTYDPAVTAPLQFDPQANFTKRRSNTLIASFKSKLAGFKAPESKPAKLNPKWSASLQSLQAIDNMVSYENMSFIDYDKFNGYEKQLEHRLSQLSLLDPALATANIIEQSEVMLQQGVTPQTPITMASVLPTPPPTILTGVPAFEAIPGAETVVRRRKTSSTGANNARKSLRSSFNLDTDYEHNLDKPRNVYRDSLDSRKLERMNDFSRNSFIMDKNLIDVLNLENGTLGGHRVMRYVRRTGSCGEAEALGDTVDGSSSIQVRYRHSIKKE